MLRTETCNGDAQRLVAGERAEQEAEAHPWAVPRAGGSGRWLGQVARGGGSGRDTAGGGRGGGGRRRQHRGSRDLRCNALLIVAGRKPPDVFLIDAFLPKTSALQIVKELRETLPGQRIVVMTALPSAQLTKKAFGAGAVACVEKPLGSGQINAIEKVMLA